jgi:prepilin-type N-terminal cleavage/methylation domain-containing protein
MRRTCQTRNSYVSGFSLMEMMIVLVIVLTISGAIFQVINLTTQRSATEQTKLDMFQEGREFMDQMSRDLRQAGYPSPRSIDEAVFTEDPRVNDLHAAAGVVKVATGDLWFEGDMDGTGVVSVVQYHLDTSTDNNCPCLKRSQLPKVNGDPLTGQDAPIYQVEVQGVKNTNIFSAYDNGVAVGLPVTTASASGTTLASVDTVQAMLTLEALNADPQTGRKPVTTLVTTVRLNNCSQAAIGYQTSCQ